MKRILITALTVMLSATAIHVYTAARAQVTEAVANDNTRTYVNSKIITECSFYRDISCRQYLGKLTVRTKVSIMRESGDGIYNISVIDGEHARESGYVYAENVEDNWPS